MYRLFFRFVLSRLSAETAHRVLFALLRIVCAIPGVRVLLGRLFSVRDESLSIEAFGKRFAHPLGLAAGFDKNAEGIESLAAMGFSFVEIGTVTAFAQPGNPRPRLFRLPADRALLNRMGFNNDGADRVAPRLARHFSLPVGANIGKTKATPEEETPADYGRSAQLLGPHADYLVVNVSSPNTPGLRSLQSVEKLRPILEEVRRRMPNGLPFFVKIAPDLADEDIDAVADLARDLGLTGVIATNTTLSREGLRTDAELVRYLGTGGVSGPPVRARSLEVLRRLYARSGGMLCLVSVGGIETADDVWERLAAGATLVQAYTGFVYAGPFFASRIVRGLRKRLRASAYTKLADVIGTSA